MAIIGVQDIMALKTIAAMASTPPTGVICI